MFILKKPSDRDFRILNFSDPQLDNAEWEEGHICRRILERDIYELVERVKPDLITISGDLAWAGNEIAYDSLADLIDSFGIPWAPVWGNHDNQGGPEYIDGLADRYMTRKNCIYEKGDPALGNGNYIICIEHEGRIVSAVFMMDSHDGATYVNDAGEECWCWAKLNELQVEWYRSEVKKLKEIGCNDSAIIMHIPCYAYRDAYMAAFKNPAEEERQKIKLEDAVPGGDCWTDDYKDSTGVMYEFCASYALDDGVFGAILECGSTKHVLVGHDHNNNTIIKHQGVKLAFSLKAGAGCYWEPILNGGTVMTVGENGVNNLYHEYVDVSDLFAE